MAKLGAKEDGLAEPATEKLKVFISYSRADTAFADELVSGLDYDGGFDVTIDRADIHEGEAWQPRLGALIAAADTIVFILSPKSAASPVCRWEVEEAHRNSKRIIPVLAVPLGGAAAPEQLAALNYVRFDEGRSFMAGLTALRRALNTDISWLREHTRLLDRAREWAAAGRLENRMLSGSDIANAKAWLQRRPKDAPEPTELHRDYIQASDQAEVTRLSAERQRAEMLQRAVTRTRVALAGALVLALATGVAGWWAFIEQRQAKKAEMALAEKVTELEKTEKELIEYYNQAGEAIRKNAQLAFQGIAAKHVADSGARPSEAAANDKAPSITDEELVKHISNRAVDLMIGSEVGGRQQYDLRYSRPVFPCPNCGITIGIGYDIGYSTREEFLSDWHDLPKEHLERLARAAELKGAQARALLAQVSDIVVPWDVTLAVFRNHILPIQARKTFRAFPQSIGLPPESFGALVSVVYNRGPSMSGDRRKEMFAIRELIRWREFQAIPEQFRAMKWIWARDEGGLPRRREEEAVLFESGILGPPPPSIPTASNAGGKHIPAIPTASVEDRMLVLSKKQFPDKAAGLTLDTDIKKSLDQAELTEFVMAVEQEFGFELPDADQSGLKTLRDFAVYAAKKAPALQ